MCIFSCDLGGTYTKWGIFDDGKLLKSGEFESGASLGGKILLERVIEKIPVLIENHSLDGIAVSSAGTIDSDTGEVIQASEIVPGYRGMNVIHCLQKAFQVPVTVENDVNCAMFAEAIAGVGKDESIIFGLTLGTGVGAAVIIDKKIYHGSNHFAGEIGYLNINGEILDLSGSTRGLSIRVAKRKNQNLDLWNGKRVFEGYFNNDIDCKVEIDRMIEAITDVITQSVCFLNPSMIVLGGGVMAQKDIILPLIMNKLNHKLPVNILKNTKIQSASFGNLAGIYGAYYYFVQKNRELYQ